MAHPPLELLKQYWSQNQRDSKTYHDTLDEALEHYAAQRAIALSRSAVPRQLLAPRMQQKNRSETPEPTLAFDNDSPAAPATGPAKALPPGWSRGRRVSASGRPYLIYIGPNDAAARSSKAAWAAHTAAVAAGPVVTRTGKRRNIEGIHDMWRTVLQQMVRRQSMPPPAGRPPSLPPSPPSPRLIPPTPVTLAARAVGAVRSRALLLLSLLPLSDATPSSTLPSEGEIPAVPLLSALLPPPLLIITTVAVITAAIIILSLLLLLLKPPRTINPSCLLLISLIFLPPAAAAPVDPNTVRAALQPLIIAFGLSAVSAAISSVAARVPDQEGGSDEEGERGQSDRESPEEGDASLPPGLGLADGGVRHSSAALASPRSAWLSPVMPSLLYAHRRGLSYSHRSIQCAAADSLPDLQSILVAEGASLAPWQWHRSSSG